MAIEFAPESFASAYPEYETLSRGNAIDKSRRHLVRHEILKYAKPGGRMLELNAGSGIDARFFAEKGFDVLATDISESAGIRIREKSAGLRLGFRNCDFLNLRSLVPERFDCIFSNFGGLNCTDELKNVFTGCDAVLNPGGFLTIVVMPKTYPWEIASAIVGNRHAFRRFKKYNAAKIGDREIPVWYHSPKAIKNALPKNFRLVAARNIGTFYPSAHFASFARFPKLIGWLIRLDERLNSWPLVPKGVGDYIVMTFQKGRI
jgi:ubiquinone/menaquinone biosynthesis C-methylase UbiE